jgi:hypothetical protein
MSKPKFRITVLIFFIVALTLASCDTGSATQREGEPSTAQCQVECVDFDSLLPGSTFQVGDYFKDSGSVGIIQAYRWIDNSLTLDGDMSVFNEDAEYMESNDENPYVLLKEVNLALVFDCPVEGLHFKYAHWMGGLNISINGDKWCTSLSKMNGEKIGGAQVTVTTDPTINNGHEEGVVMLTGHIDSFSVGGEQLAIDDVCSE